MHENNLSKVSNVSLNLYVTSSMVIIRQYGFWCDVKRVYQLVPTSLQGYVVATCADVPLGTLPLYAWVVYRPTSLMLSWSPEKSVYFYELETQRAREMFNENREWFKIVGRVHGTTM